MPLGATRMANPMQRWSGTRYAASVGRRASIERCVREIALRVAPEPVAISCLVLLYPSSIRRNAIATLSQQIA